MADSSSTGAVFKPRARLLLLLGDQLIKDSGLAVFELVKNAYDADATRVNVTLHEVWTPDGEVTVEDDGSGMTLATIKNVWLEPGTDFRAAQRDKRLKSPGPRTADLGRLPLGEKGVGRFAAGKLGNVVELVTRSKGRKEVVVVVDWEALARKKYLSDAQISISERTPQVFKGSATGTRITISRLRETWTRRQVRDLARKLTSMTSPFGGPTDFTADLCVEPNNGWLANISSVEEMLEQSIYRATGSIDDTEVTYAYEFTPPAALNQVAARHSKKVVPLPPVSESNTSEDGFEDEDDENEELDLRGAGIGDIGFEFRVFDRDSVVMKAATVPRSQLKQYLDANGGVRVYRDGMRVFSYGEPGDDWLDLGARRVNSPTKRVSNNQVIGAVSIDLASSPALIEKTNREGFVDNEAARMFARAVSFALQQVTAERNLDKERIRKAYRADAIREPVLQSIEDLRAVLGPSGPDVERAIHRIESEFVETRDRLLTAAGTGLSLIVVIHEVEKGIDLLRRSVERGASPERLEELANHLADVVQGLAYLSRRSGIRQESISAMGEQALQNLQFRLEAHGVRVTNAFKDGKASVRCSRRLIVASLMNLIDNSIYWMDVEASRTPNAVRQMWIGPYPPSSSVTGIILADSGPGFIDSPELLVEAMVSRREDGMGIGLHLANEVMLSLGGSLGFPSRAEIGLPNAFTGAIVGLEFPKGSLK